MTDTLQKPGLIAEIEPLHWQTHIEEFLASPSADELIQARRTIARNLGLAAVFFTESDIMERVDLFAEHEVLTGRAERAVYVNMLNGGTPFHNDLIEAIKNHGVSPRTDHMRTTAYDGTEFVGAHVVEDPKYLPRNLRTGDEVVLTDDGLDTGESLIESGRFIRERYGVTDIAALTALTKQPGMVIAKFRGTTSMFSTPSGLWGEYYGFNDDARASEPGYNRDERVIGLAMAQPEGAYDKLEHVINVLGGTAGIAVATIDEIRAFNKARN